MRRLLTLGTGLVVLLAVGGCSHYYAGVCDCERTLSCGYECCPTFIAGGPPAATILQPTPIQVVPAPAPVPAVPTKEPEKIAAPGK